MRVKKALKVLLLFLKPSLLFLLVILFGFFLFAFFSAGEIYEYKDTVDGVHLPKVDVIVCLAGGRGRITQASDLWYRYYELSQMPIRGAGRSPVPPSVP
ncbi:MAG: hypothetical protein HY072_05770, partial [Deltaproteobacteria bacterium]|nr:hypothetical protein [Deltaproteobacteria bacterium]